MDVFQNAIRLEPISRPNHRMTYTFACNGCGKEVRGYANSRVRGHIWCNDCNKKRQRKYIANSKKRSVLAEIKDNLDIHEIDGVLYYKVEDVLKLFKTEVGVMNET